ncbi:G-type lectin S-receptor-like serine/threonine-protein kinase [Striga hermonthica]|uniref:Receptor-like serine/threonine-protein kinase n=1 Tax=Striga hermonthica TaxID=68872 RepID=A0A9N7NY54_STRHE|nr:G-type lectin S-receptor-like serine/threonine-protein kinase [Striga hermonthica]
MGSSAAAAAAAVAFLLLLFLSPALSGPVSFLPISPNFTASYLLFVNTSGAFLASPNSTFQARITTPKPESKSFHFLVSHVPSNTIVWSANRNHPVSSSSELRLTSDGLALFDDAGRPVWSASLNVSSSVSSMQLLESGNLVLLDHANDTVWQSFDFPADVLVPGQKLPVGINLTSSAGDGDLSEGNYRFAVEYNDAVLTWNEMRYWELSMDGSAFRDTDFAAGHLEMNSTGLFLMGENGVEVVIKVIIGSSTSGNSSYFQIVRLDPDGVLRILSFGGDESNTQLFSGPNNRCQVPFICGRLGVCTGNGGSCQCAPAFHTDPNTNTGDCVPSDASLALLPSGSCNGSFSSSSSSGVPIKYLNLTSDLDYFANYFTDFVTHNTNLSACQSLCSGNCSCRGVFYSPGSRSCYLIRNYFGSLLTKSSPTDRVGYVKTEVVGITHGYSTNHRKSGSSILPAVLLPSFGVVLVALIAALICSKRKRLSWEKFRNSKRESHPLADEEEMDLVSIPGLPVRFDYQEIVEATRGFSTQIGSGGFGTVYKGILKEGTEVAVKKITCLGAQGKREFLTEIAVIGKIHHVNLVRLKGFCASRGQRFLVYEYMNRGSLDQPLFRDDVNTLEWKERVEIAVGTARGLAYLHSGCEHKIIHCDIKPENILLHDHGVKISDFGLSKLLGPEQSALFTTMRGTRGYLAPEWLTSASISDRTDVYSYGMLLLEIVRGKKNSCPHNDIRNNRMVYFPLFALEMHEDGRYLEVLDPRLAGQVAAEEAERLVRVALCCVHEEPNMRPSMKNVVGMLEGGVPLGEPRAESLSFLRFYGRRFTEESTLGGRGNELMMMHGRTASGSAATSYNNTLSYMSSQDVSGPR